MIRRLFSTPEGIAGTLILGLLAAAALAAPVLFPRDPLSIAGPALLQPFQDPAHILGTDRLGRDVLAGIFHPSDDESAHATIANAWIGPVGDSAGGARR